jgi:tetratricopeptide (TPR) repeat protein
VSDRGTVVSAVSQDLGQDARATVAPGQDARATTLAPAWLDEHLLGFVAESEPEYRSAEDPGRDPRPALEQALVHYDRVLTIRPGAFWGHYRAAAACFGLGRMAEAAEHLTRCLERRPGNDAIQMQLGACLIDLKRYPEALQHCDLALARAPSYAELYRTRAYARLGSRHTGGVGADLEQFEFFSQILPRSYRAGAEAVEPRKILSPNSWGTAGPQDARPRVGSIRRGGRDEGVPVDSEEIEVRAKLADELRKAGQYALASAELEKILVLRPDHIPTRMMRAELAIEARRFDAARAELDVVLAHPELEDYARSSINSLTPFFTVTRLYLKAGKADEARAVAERARDLAILLDQAVGQAHFNLARVYAALGKSDVNLIEDAAKQLFRSFVAHPDFQQWYRDDGRSFNPVRTRIEAAMARMEDPVVVRSRILASRSATPAQGVDR